MASNSTLFDGVNKDFLTCSICKEIFKHPKQLKCMHSFCQGCLEPLVTNEKPCNIKCPLCRADVELKTASVFEIEDNVFLTNLCDLYVVSHLGTMKVMCSFCSEELDKDKSSRCIDCSDNLCDKCAKVHTLTRLTRNHKVILMSEIEVDTLVKRGRNEQIKIPCQTHPSHHLEYFCETCQVPVCIGCTVVDHVRQNDHQLLNLLDEATKQKFENEITEEVKKLEEMMPSFQKHVRTANDVETCLEESLERTKVDIQQTATDLIDKIKAKANELIEKVEKRGEVIQKVVEHHRDSAEIRIKSSTGINQFAKNLCKHGLNAEIMSSFKDLLRQIKELQENIQDLTISGQIRFVSEQQFHFGKLEEAQIIEEEGNILKSYAEKYMLVNQPTKRGPNWPTEYIQLDNCGEYPNTITSIQKKDLNEIEVTVACYNQGNKRGYNHGYNQGYTQNVTGKMNPNNYWLQPAEFYGNYMKQLELYAKHYMEVGDEVKRGINWPEGHGKYDNNGLKSGKIIQINTKQGNATAVVEFGPAPYDAMQCPMYLGCYCLLPLKDIIWNEWVEF